MDDTKSVAVVVLLVMCIILFVAFVSSVLGMNKKNANLQNEIAQRLGAEEQLQKALLENANFNNDFLKLKEELLETKAKTDEAIKALGTERLTSQQLKDELEKEKLLNQKLQSDLKDALAKSRR